MKSPPLTLPCKEMTVKITQKINMHVMSAMFLEHPEDGAQYLYIKPSKVNAPP